ncbi:MAG: sulfatase [Candidatus Eisenbacteria bacterium]
MRTGRYVDRWVRAGRRAPSVRARWGAACVSVGLVAAALSGSCAERESPRNILLITLDTVRADRLGCYGFAEDTSPFLDSVAATSVRFLHALSPSAMTPASHASILTGLYPYNHGLRVIYAERGCVLSNSIPTLAGVLQSEGWSTGAFLSSFTVSEFYGFDRGFDVYDSGLLVPADRSFVLKDNGIWSWPVPANQRRADKTAEEAIRWLKEQEGPYLAWVHFWDPHDLALLPPDSVLGRFVTSEEETEDWMREVYEAEIFWVDRSIRRIFETLEEKGDLDRTIVVIVADHGQGLGDHGWWGHRILYQEQIRVPLLLKGPGIDGGKTIDNLVRTIDLYPTLLEMLGVDPPEAVDGRSLLPILRGRSDPPRTAYAEALNQFDLNAAVRINRPEFGLLYSTILGDWKLIHRPNSPGESELYNLAEDPDELINRYAEEPAIADSLLGILDEFGGWVAESFGSAADQEIIDKLRSLGYVDE